MGVQQHVKSRAVQECEFAQVDDNALGAAGLRIAKMSPEDRRRREIELTAERQDQRLSLPGRLNLQLATHHVEARLASCSGVGDLLLSQITIDTERGRVETDARASLIASVVVIGSIAVVA